MTLTTPFAGRIDLDEASDAELFFELLYNSDSDLGAFTGDPHSLYGDRDDSYAKSIRRAIEVKTFGPAKNAAKASGLYLGDAEASEAARLVVAKLQKPSDAEANGIACANGSTISAIAKRRVIQKDIVAEVDRGKFLRASGVKGAPKREERRITVTDPTAYAYESAVPDFTIEEDIDQAADHEVAMSRLNRARSEMADAEALVAEAESLKDATLSEKAATLSAAHATRDYAAGRLAKAEALARQVETDEARALRWFREETAAALTPQQQNVLLDTTGTTPEVHDYLDRQVAEEAGRMVEASSLDADSLAELLAQRAAEAARLMPLQVAVREADAAAEDALMRAEAAEEEYAAAKKARASKSTLDDLRAAMDGAAAEARMTASVASDASEDLDREAVLYRSLTARIEGPRIDRAIAAMDKRIARRVTAYEDAQAAERDAHATAAKNDPRVYRDQTDAERAAVAAVRRADAQLARAIEAKRQLAVRAAIVANDFDRTRRVATERLQVITRMAGSVASDTRNARWRAQKGDHRAFPQAEIARVRNISERTVRTVLSDAKTNFHGDLVLAGSLRTGSTGDRVTTVKTDTLANALYLIARTHTEDAGGQVGPQYAEALPDSWFEGGALAYGVPSTEVTEDLIGQLREALVSRLDADQRKAAGRRAAKAVAA